MHDLPNKCNYAQKNAPYGICEINWICYNLKLLNYTFDDSYFKAAHDSIHLK